MATTRYVATTGHDDTGDGTQGNPYATVTKAITVAVAGDTIHITPGVYTESVTHPSKSNITYFGEEGAILDGGGTLSIGIYQWNGATGIHIEGLEIRNYRQRGIVLAGSAQWATTNNVVTNCHIHHIIGTTAGGSSYGIWCSNGNPTVTNNVIHDVGWIGESMGVYFGKCYQPTADNNTIWGVRKEAIRDWVGYGATITNNRVTHIGFAGIAPNGSVGALVANNMISFCMIGINAKHVNAPLNQVPEAGVLEYWGLTPETVPGWTRIWHNTVYRCQASSVRVDGVPLEAQLDIRNNIFEGTGGSYLEHSVGAAVAPFTIDYNVYSTHEPAAWAWFHVYQTYSAAYLKTFAQMQTDIGIEAHGSNIDPQLNDPLNGDLDYPDSSPAATVGAACADQLTGTPSPWGSQVGARGFQPPNVTWKPWPVTVLSASSLGYNNVGYLLTADEIQQTGCRTNTGANEWFIYDFGAQKTFNGMNFTPQGHQVPWNVKQMRVEVSDNQVDWTQVLDRGATDTDSNLSGFPWMLDVAEATGRYVRFTAVSSFGSTYMYVMDVQFGVLDANPPPPARNYVLPAATLYPSATLYPAGDTSVDVERAVDATLQPRIQTVGQRTLQRTISLAATTGVATTAHIRTTYARSAAAILQPRITSYGLRITSPPEVESHPGLNGTYDQTATGGRVARLIRAGSIQTVRRGGDLVLTGTGGNPTQPRRGGIHDEAATGGQVR